MISPDLPTVPRVISLLRLIPVAASFALITMGNAKAEESLHANQDPDVEQRYDPAKNPKLQLEHKIQNLAQNDDKQKQAELGITQPQQQVLDTSKPSDMGGPGGPGGPEKKTGWNFEAGAAMIYGPAYDGSDEMKLKAVPTISVDYEDGLFFAGIGGIGSYPIQGDNYKLGVSIGRSFGREEKKDRKNLRGMGDIDSSTRVSLMGEYGFGPVEVSGKLTKGNSDYGVTATMDISTRFPITNDLMLMTSAGLTWADADHMNTFFGVSPTQAARSGYSRYQAGSGIQSVGVNAGAFYALTKDVDIALMLSADKLVGDAADSPITHKDFQPSLFLMTSYKF